MFGLFKKKKRKHLLPDEAVRSDDIVSVFYGAIRRETAF